MKDFCGGLPYPLVIEVPHIPHHQSLLIHFLFVHLSTPLLAAYTC